MKLGYLKHLCKIFELFQDRDVCREVSHLIFVLVKILRPYYSSPFSTFLVLLLVVFIFSSTIFWFSHES